MKKASFQLIPLVVAFALALPMAASAATPTVVKVQLWDKGTSMGVELSRDSVPAGPVTFVVKNVSKGTVHEMLVMYLADPSKLLPYIQQEGKTTEDKSIDKGEVSELAPSKSGKLTVDLQPGKYVLICNVPGHFAAGMWSTFTVTE